MSSRLNVKVLEITGFYSALYALRLPYGKEVRSTCLVKNEVKTTPSLKIETSSCVEMDPRDLLLMERLVKNGDEHAKVIRGIMVYMEIAAPRWFWQEMDTYRVGTDRLSSESTMHIDAKGLSEEELMEFKDSLQESKIQRRVQVFSYQTLRRIYFQRRNHRLPVWREFCSIIETLPLSDRLITTDKMS